MEFNARLRSYGSPDWDGKINPADFGPALGKAQGCTDCHNGRSRANLSVALSRAQLEKKLYYELSMPPDTTLPGLLERNQMKDPELSESEAELLRRALETHETMTYDYERSRLPLLKQWLLQVPCRPGESDDDR
jgi:hypothetical protein